MWDNAEPANFNQRPLASDSPTVSLVDRESLSKRKTLRLWCLDTAPILIQRSQASQFRTADFRLSEHEYAYKFRCE